MGGGRIWLGVAAMVAGGWIGCDDREDRVVRPPSNDDVAGGSSAAGGAGASMPNAAGGSNGAGEASGGSEAAGGEASVAAGGEAVGGAAGSPSDDPCPGCDSVASQTSDFGMSWQSSWFLVGCKEQRAHDCVTALPAPCRDASLPFEDQGVSTLETFPIGGVPGRHYKVTFTFNAIASAKEYEGGTRDQGTAVPYDYDGLWDAFYRDGQPIPSNYDPWQLSVLDEAGVELRHYYMNAFPPGGFESHRTFRLTRVGFAIRIGLAALGQQVGADFFLAIADQAVAFVGEQDRLDLVERVGDFDLLVLAQVIE